MQLNILARLVDMPMDSAFESTQVMEEQYVDAQQIVWETHANVCSHIACHFIRENRSLIKSLDPSNKTTLLTSVDQMLI